MKANAPEKLYFSATENGTHYYTEGIPFERNYIEYIHKDAFIEKACKYFRTKKKCVFACIGEDVNHPLLNEEEIEDFKKYMEDEV